MEHSQPMQLQTPTVEYDEVAVMDVADEGDGGPAVARHPTGHLAQRTPARKTRSLSDGGHTPQRFLPAELADARRTSKDDSTLTFPIRESISTPAAASASTSAISAIAPPVTPHRSVFPSVGLALHMPAATPPTQQPVAPYSKPAPPSPKLDHSQTYSSPTNILPRRSRGLDFSRAATSLHHTTLAEQASPDSSPTISGRAINIPGRRPGEFGAPEQTSNSLWSMMGNHERHNISTSLGSAVNMVSDSDSSSDGDDLMDEDMDEPYLMTPQVTRNNPSGPQAGSGFGSPAVNNFLSFQQRQRPRKHPKKKARVPLGLGFSNNAAGSSMLSKSPPINTMNYGSMAKEMSTTHARRESISWAANQLHISGSESEDNPKPGVNVDGVLGPGADGQNRVVRRPVTRRSNLLVRAPFCELWDSALDSSLCSPFSQPKSKTFARIKLALAEEGTPIESEFRREAEVVRQVRESDMDLEHPRQIPQPKSTHSSPSMPVQDSLEEEDAMMMDSSVLGLSSSFKQQAQKNSKGRVFWDTFSETSSMGGAQTTPPPPPGPPRGSSSGLSLDDINMDSPSLNAGPSGVNGFIFPMTTTSSSGGDTPQQQASASSSMPPNEHAPPSAAEITRRFNMGKRRRDDDLDPVSFKRRAVSPGMSVHNSPVMQSPMQHAPWGPRPGSNGGEKGSSGSGAGSAAGTPSENGEKRTGAPKGRVGFQGMIDTNDGITRLSIE